MILVSNGCSHTAGAELEYPSQRRCYEKAWPKHLSELLGYEHINLADSGASCHRVLRTTMRFILDCLSEKKDMSKYFFIVAWPGMFRTELRRPVDCKDKEYLLYYDDDWLPLIVGNDDAYKSLFSNRLYAFYKSWIATMDGVKPALDYLHSILLLQNFMTLYKIKYRFYNASPVSIPSYDELSGYKGLIDKKNFPSFDYVNQCLTSILYSNNQNISSFSVDSGLSSHYDEEAQKWLANYIYKELQ